MSLSVVVPVWRDAPAVARLLASHPSSPAEWIVVSVDDPDEDAALTPVLAAAPHVRWVRRRRGRGPQQNAGAAAAHGEWLLFLHADSSLPEGWLDEIRYAATRARPYGWGCFRFALDSDAWQARLLERVVALRVRLGRLPYGDQGIFLRRDVFQSTGGFPPYPLMEDVALVRRLSAHGPPYRSPLPLRTSARRWQQDGWLRRSLRNLSVLARYMFGVPPERLVRPYERPRD